MTKVIFAVTLTLITFALTKSANTRINDAITKDTTTTLAMDQGDSNGSSSNLDIETIMNACNESYRVEMAYLEALNESGSFIDETDKTPKCFIRCMLENLGVVEENGGPFNPARAAVLFAGERNGKPMDDIGDMTALCAADRQEKCLCDRSYKFIKCLMSMEIERYEKS